MWLLDTNVWVRYLNPGDTPVKSRIHQHAPDRLILCDVVKAELYFGAYKSSRQRENLQLLRNLFDHFPSLAFDGKAALIFGKIRADLHRQGNPIGLYDLQIGAIALANNLTLGDCPRIAIVARARLVERDFFDHLRRIVVLFNEKDREIRPIRLVRSRLVCSRAGF